MILQADACRLPILDESVACIVTSPPYNTGIKYPGYEDKRPWNDYRNMAYDSLLEMYRVLKPGGRLWLNVQAVVPLIPGQLSKRRVDLLSLWSTAADDVGFEYRDTVAWTQDSFDGACAWGSWLSPSAPNLRGSWEPILLLYKEHWKREAPEYMRQYRADRFYPDDTSEDWTDLVRNVWSIGSRNTSKYPAVFPETVASRAIRLSTWPQEYVLDPFSGSGTTAKVASQLDRIGIGVDMFPPDEFSAVLS